MKNIWIVVLVVVAVFVILLIVDIRLWNSLGEKAVAKEKAENNGRHNIVQVPGGPVFQKGGKYYWETEVNCLQGPCEKKVQEVTKKRYAELIAGTITAM